mmetsp:Transcript_50048/g.79481  ORF Transcript_50048/g.79481 Transcript_50048/m.79481 type:complete len:80 (+) Transcript_50048:759-998(+)
MLPFQVHVCLCRIRKMPTVARRFQNGFRMLWVIGFKFQMVLCSRRVQCLRLRRLFQASFPDECIDFKETKLEYFVQEFV